MAASHFMVAAAVTAALTGTATAQTTVSSTASPSAQISTAANTSGTTRSHWVAAGFVSSGFNNSGDSPLIDDNEHHFGFGGQAGYLYRGVVGAEFLADFAPTSRDSTTVLALDKDSSVNSYMANAIGAYPLGAKGQFQPYASGGLGRVALATDVFNVAGNPESGTDRLREGRLGLNVGGGLMAFASHVGVRSDVRWFRATTDNNPPPATDPINTQVAQALLSGLEFWRANVGVAFRW
jgi:outer membrane protein with beta-barrel domain